jgi:translocation and assembly module TamB
MEATGPASSPILQFSSTPPLSSERIVLMITAGQLPGPQQVVSTQQRAQAFALFLGRDVLSRLGIGDESEQRLTVQSGEQISEQGSPTYLVEYKLSDDWFLVGEYDRFDELNVGVRWRVYSK